MIAGREMDALVAEKVVGWVWLPDRILGPDPGVLFLFSPARVAMMLEKHVADNRVIGPVNEPPPANLPRFSTDIAAAMEVVEKLRTWNDNVSFCFELLENSEHGGSPEWLARFERYQAKPEEYDTAGWSSADTAPHAICLAALAAVGAEVPA